MQCVSVYHSKPPCQALISGNVCSDSSPFEVCYSYSTEISTMFISRHVYMYVYVERQDRGRWEHRLFYMHNSSSEPSYQKSTPYTFQINSKQYTCKSEYSLNLENPPFCFLSLHLTCFFILEMTRHLQDEECDPQTVSESLNYIHKLIIINSYGNSHERKNKFCIFFSIFFPNRCQ